MTIEQPDVIDFILVEPEGDTVLTISDHLPWDDEKEHLLHLQEKLNAYVRYVQSGEIYQKWPDAAGKPILIEVVVKHAVPKESLWFFEKATAAIMGAGFKFRVRAL
jgi:hypothetical protein